MWQAHMWWNSQCVLWQRGMQLLKIVLQFREKVVQFLWEIACELYTRYKSIMDTITQHINHGVNVHISLCCYIGTLTCNLPIHSCYWKLLLFLPFTYRIPYDYNEAPVTCLTRLALLLKLPILFVFIFIGSPLIWNDVIFFYIY